MRKLTPFLCVCFGILFLNPIISSAQFTAPVSVGAGIGGTQLYGDLANRPLSLGGHVEIDYLFTPYISVGVQGLMGSLKADDNARRDVVNDYIGANLNAKFRLGQLLFPKRNYSLHMNFQKDLLSYLGNVYIGAGIGVLHADINAYRGDPNSPNSVAFYAGSDGGMMFNVPLNVGIDIPFGRTLYGPVWALNLNYQLGVFFSDDLDGYNNSFSKYNDRMSYVSIGFKRALFMGLKK